MSKDWAPNVVKTECGTTQAIVGLSADPTTKLVHGALCTSDEPATFTRSACHAVAFDSTGAASCAASEFAAGISTNKGLPQSILCCAGLPKAATSCAPLTLATTDARETGTTSGDWDAKQVKLERGPSRFVAGAKRATSGSTLTAVTCCGQT